MKGLTLKDIRGFEYTAEDLDGNIVEGVFSTSFLDYDELEVTVETALAEDGECVMLAYDTDDLANQITYTGDWAVFRRDTLDRWQEDSWREDR
jgi:azurin